MSVELKFAWLVGVLIGVLPMTLSARDADRRESELLVFAAASLTDVLEEIGREYQSQANVRVTFSFAASSGLARQIEAGARAHVFFSADQQWMDYLQAKGLIDASSRRDVVANRLVLVVPEDSTLELKIAPNFPLARALGKRRLATGDPDIVPAGRYARSALMALGVWKDVENRLVRAENVRTALAFIARGESPLGIVYETDALVEKRVRILDVFPVATHPPIVYPVATAAKAGMQARAFIHFLAGAQAQAIFERYGFRSTQ